MNTSWVFIFIHIVLVLKKDDSIHSFDFGNLIDFSKSGFKMFFFRKKSLRGLPPYLIQGTRGDRAG